jgi:hypothetical protein
MITAHKVEQQEAVVPFQEASLDIWDKKYRLTAKDGTAVDHSDGRHLPSRGVGASGC